MHREFKPYEIDQYVYFRDVMLPCGYRVWLSCMVKAQILDTPYEYRNECVEDFVFERVCREI